MEITNIKKPSLYYLSCDIDGHPAIVPWEQKPTLVRNGVLFVIMQDGSKPPMVKIAKNDPLYPFVGEAVQGVRSLGLLAAYKRLFRQ